MIYKKYSYNEYDLTKALTYLTQNLTQFKKYNYKSQ